ATIDFWYDFSSPFSYLAATEIERVAAFAGARVVWRPMLLGAVFRDIGMANVPLFSMSEVKRRAMIGDLQAWASWWGVPFRWPAKFPQKTVTALRLALLAGDRIGEVSLALFRAIWSDGRNLEEDAVCAEALASVGIDGAAQLAATQAPATKQALIDSTAEAVKSGVFGAPTFVVKRAGAEDRLYWGQDRLGLVARAALGVAVPWR
ncbi:MAG TPA: 2-hydroxychromene-2-carboxylate isomerase, partial [Kofleriaceae bacterium]|nr:2-hydroxychromene-2-carboxylate isomerase [Kofleriaceae bacterium]